MIETVLMFQADPVYSIMLLHIFGALFGVMVSWVLHREGINPKHEKEKTDRNTGLFAMLGEYNNQLSLKLRKYLNALSQYYLGFRP